MKQTLNEIEINGVVYVPKGETASIAPSVDGLPLVILRTERAGVHYGYLKSRTGGEAFLINTRRIWYWEGAASLSQLAQEGVSKPQTCKFTVTLPEATILGVIEVLPVTKAAKHSIDGVKEWKQ
jgi:hypothetical protein